MRIVMMAINDPAGAAIAQANALNRHTGHECRLITKELRYNFMFQKDLHEEWLLPEDRHEVAALLESADVFHFHMTADEDLSFCGLCPRDFMQGKTLVHHHHGHHDFRSNPLKFQHKYKERRRRKLLVSTPDLLHLLPGARWQPNIVPLFDPLYRPMPGKPESPVRVAHSPTRKDLKNTDEFLEVMRLVRAEGHDVALELIENTAHVECLRTKRRCHILFDHLQGYFGVSSLEALSQGLCVVAGLDDWNQAVIREFTGAEELPWVVSSLASLERDLRTLLLDRDARKERGQRSREFMLRYWTEQSMIRHLAAFYEE
jgi:hypothetical protein